MRGVLTTLLVLCAFAAAAAEERGADPGIRLSIDLERFELQAQDALGDVEGPRFPVAVGSPAHPTPAGSFAASRVILNPAWQPGARARAAGAVPEPPSRASPMGAAKIPFAEGGAIALHGGGDPLLLGKPVSTGCVRARDADLLALVAWLDARRALGAPRERGDGEVHRGFRRQVRVLVREGARAAEEQASRGGASSPRNPRASSHGNSVSSAVSR